jgi:hypothetical protein
MLGLLEWSAFGASLLSAWLYGSRPVWGAIVGIICCGLFFAFGLASGIYAAVVANIIFLVVHIRNIRKLNMSDPAHNAEKIRRILANYSSKFGGIRSLADTRAALAPMKGLNALRDICHEDAVAAGWWKNIKTGEVLPFHAGQKFNLVHSELSEALEADRKKLRDDKLPHRSGVEVELGDALIRLFDTAGKLGYDLEEDFHSLATHPLEFFTGADFHDQLAAIHADINVAWASYTLNAGNSPDTRFAMQTAIARILNLGEFLDIDIPGATAEKYAFNRVRPDHKIENRLGIHGKDY